MRARIGVVGGCGGVGASTFAAVLAWAAGAVLVDLDALGGGIDVLLGIERVPGARWSQLHLAGGRLEPRLLREGLPHWRGVPVLAADRSPPAGGVPAVLAAVTQLGPIVLDLPRADTPPRRAALAGCDLLVLVAAARVAALTAARAVLSALVDAPQVPVAVLLRRGEVAPAEAAALLEQPVLGTLPTFARPIGPAGRPPPRGLARVAAGVVDGLRAATGEEGVPGHADGNAGEGSNQESGDGLGDGGGAGGGAGEELSWAIRR